MSCDHELANEKTRCSGKNASYITRSFISCSRDETMACFEWITVWITWLCFQGYRFNLYSLRFQWEFAVTVKGFTFVSLVCRKVHISYVENICKRRRSLIPAVVANLPAAELFAGVRSPEVIRTLKFFLWYHGLKYLKILRLFQAL